MSFVGNLGSSLWDVAKVPLSVIPGVGNYLGSMESASATKDANEKNLQAVRETNAANAALWREQTAYNTPENQVQRLRNAGLNPMLAYGTVAEGRAASAPIMHEPEVRPIPGRDYGKFSLAEYQQVMNMNAQNALIRSQIALAIESADVAKANARKSNADADATEYETAALRKAGMIRGDSSPLKWGTRKAPEFIENSRNAIDRSGLYKKLGDLAEMAGYYWQRLKSRSIKY